MSEIQFLDQIPGAREFVDLRVAAGLSPNSIAAAEAGLRGSWCAICVRAGAKLIGMGRIIGDGGCFFQIVDIAVLPDYQGQGIGYGIMERLMKRLHEDAPRSAYVSLIADGDASRLYSKFGFEFTEPVSAGMALRL